MNKFTPFLSSSQTASRRTEARLPSESAHCKMKTACDRPLLLLVLFVAVGFLVGPSARAQTGVQDDYPPIAGGTASGLWDTGTNWSLGSAPTGTTGTDAVFINSSAAETVTLSSTESALGVVISNTNAVTFSGGTLTLGSDGLTLNAGSGAFTTNGGLNLQLVSSQTWTNNSGNTATLGVTGAGVIGYSGSSTVPIVLTITGSSSFSTKTGFANSVAGGVFSVIVDLKQGASFTDQNSGHTYSGGTQIESGQYTIYGTGAFGTGTVSLGGTAGPYYVGQAEIYSQSSPTVVNAINVLSGGTSSVIYANGGNATYSGPITLGGNLVVGSAATSKIVSLSGTISGGGNLSVTTGAVTVSGTNSYSGGTTVTGGLLTVSNTAALGAAGAALNVSGATVDLKTSSSVNAYNTTITGNTTIDSDVATAGNAGITQQLGTLTIGGNTLTIAAGANVTGGAPVVAFGAATLTSTASATTTIAASTAGVTLGSVAGSAVLATATNTLAFTGTNTNEQITGAISNGSGAGAVALSVSAGLLTLSGSSTYTGATTITSSTLAVTNAGAGPGAAGGTLGATNVKISTGGTLLLGASNALGTSTLLTGSTGSTIRVNNGNFSQGTGAQVTGYTTFDSGHNAYTGGSIASGANLSGIGALTLSGSSTLDFGTGRSTLVFSSISGLSATNVLNILNYTSSASPTVGGSSGTDGVDDRLIYSGTELSSTLLADVKFNGVADAVQLDLTGGYYEITAAVPEPTTVFGGLLLVGLIGYRERRRVGALCRAVVQRA